MDLREHLSDGKTKEQRMAGSEQDLQYRLRLHSVPLCCGAFCYFPAATSFRHCASHPVLLSRPWDISRLTPPFVYNLRATIKSTATPCQSTRRIWQHLLVEVIRECHLQKSQPCRASSACNKRHGQRTAARCQGLSPRNIQEV